MEYFNYLESPLVDLFRLLANCFLLFCSDLAVLIFPRVMVDFQRPNWKSAQDPWGGDIQIFNPFPFYCFTLVSILSHNTLNNFPFLATNKAKQTKYRRWDGVPLKTTKLKSWTRTIMSISSAAIISYREILLNRKNFEIK